MTAITRALSAALLHFVWQGLGVTILLWVALFLLRKRSATLRYAASCAALAMLVAMPVATTWLLYEHPAPAAPNAGISHAADSPTPLPASPDAPAFDWMNRIESWIIPVWSCGVLLFSFRMVWGCGRVAGMRRRGEGADERLIAALSALAKRMGVARPVGLLVSNATDSPSVTGWLRPIILLPVSAIAGLTPDQLEAVLAHELAHIRRHDYLVNLLQMAAETVLFYHPAVWWISARIRHERELCCDDLAVRACGGALCYARALTALEKMRAGHPALALGSTDGPLFLRIRRLISGGGEYGPSKLSGMVAASLGILCVALCMNWAHGQEPMRAIAFTAGSAQDGEGVSVDVAGAALIHRTGVEYPRNLISKHIEGTVSVEATLDTSGSVVDAHVLSGPEELRKAALASVLDWHFAPGSGTTRIVNIGFRTPATPAEPERKTAERKSGGAVSVRTPDDQVVTLKVERERTAQTAEFLMKQLTQARKQMEIMQSDPGSDPNDLQKARTELAQLEQKVVAAQSVQSEAEQRVQLRFEPANPEQRREMDEVKRRQFELRRATERVGRKVAAIEIRGLSDASGNDLLSRLPVHEGDTLTAESIEATTKAIRQFDEHLEFSYGGEPEGVVLRIHPPGAAGGLLLQRK